MHITVNFQNVMELKFFFFYYLKHHYWTTHRDNRT